MGNYVSVRLENRSKSKVGGNRNHDLRVSKIPNYVDQSLSYQNSILFDYDSPSEIANLAIERREVGNYQRKIKSTASIAVAGIITFSHDAQKIIEKLSPQEQDHFFKNHIENLAIGLKTHIHGATVHRDESSIHCHFLLSGYNDNGRSLSSVVGPKVASEVQDHAGEMWGSLGITRGEKKHSKIQRLRSEGKTEKEISREVIHRSVRGLHQDLPLEIHDKNQELEEAATAVEILKKQLFEIQQLEILAINKKEKNERLHAESLYKLEKAQSDLAKVEKIKKNLGHYENRSATAEREINSLENKKLELEKQVAAVIQKRQEIKAFENVPEKISLTPHKFLSNSGLFKKVEAYPADKIHEYIKVRNEREIALEWAYAQKALVREEEARRLKNSLDEREIEFNKKVQLMVENENLMAKKGLVINHGRVFEKSNSFEISNSEEKSNQPKKHSYIREMGM